MSTLIQTKPRNAFQRLPLKARVIRKLTCLVKGHHESPLSEFRGFDHIELVAICFRCKNERAL
jgi:hypothetical protein